jgi:transcriptional regulator with PAS, ATPase and Fis domain
MSGAAASPEPRAPGPSAPAKAQEVDPGGIDQFRWQALFQRSHEPIFVLNRNRRILFVNCAWEKLTGLSVVEARGLVCRRHTPMPGEPLDVTIRSLCCPPPEVLGGKAGRCRRLVPATTRWWDLDFLPLLDDAGLLCLIGKITPVVGELPASAPPLPQQLLALQEQRRQRYGLDQLASAMPGWKRVLEQVRLAAHTSIPVLLTGEPGTGKQWLARTIHLQSARREQSFIALDCGLPAVALDAVLFSDACQPATVYLRNPLRLGPEMQQRLAARLQAPAGEQAPRFLAGSSPDPLAEVKTKRLPSELMDSFSTLVIAVPPLRERREDLPLLVERLLERISCDWPRRVTGLSQEAMELLNAYSWPGNIRELLEVLRNAALRTPDDRIAVPHLSAALRLAVRLDETPAPASDRPLSLDHLLEEAERRLIRYALRQARGNRSRAAELLSIWRPRLLRRMEALGIKEF